MTSIQIALLVGLIIFIIWLIWNNSRPIDGIDRDLLAAANGNKELARRLLIQARAKYPGKSEKWYAEKALYNLNRDRFKFSVARKELQENMFLLGSVMLLINSLASLFSHWSR